MSTPDYEAQAKAREAAEDDARQIEKGVVEARGETTLSAEDADKRGQELETKQAEVAQDRENKATEVDLPPAGQTGTAQPLGDQPAAKNQGSKQRK